jgi:hypothetical protein
MNSKHVTVIITAFYNATELLKTVFFFLPLCCPVKNGCRSLNSEASRLCVLLRLLLPVASVPLQTTVTAVLDAIACQALLASPAPSLLFTHF